MHNTNLPKGGGEIKYTTFIFKVMEKLSRIFLLMEGATLRQEEYYATASQLQLLATLGLILLKLSIMFCGFW